MHSRDIFLSLERQNPAHGGESSSPFAGFRSSLTTMYSNDVNDVMPLDVCWCIKASRVDMSVRMLLQGIIVWQVYLWCRRYFRKEFVRSCDACQRTGKARISNPERSCG